MTIYAITKETEYHKEDEIVEVKKTDNPIFENIDVYETRTGVLIHQNNVKQIITKEENPEMFL